MTRFRAPRSASLRAMILALAAGWALRAAPLPDPVLAQSDPSLAIVRWLELHGLTAKPTEVLWVDGPNGFLSAKLRAPTAVVRARRSDEPADIYLLAIERSPEGRVVDVSGVYNVTDTSAVDERQLELNGPRIAWTIGDGDRTATIHYADLRGQPRPQGWSRLTLWKYELTNLQNTGRRAGIRRRSFKLAEPTAQTILAFTPDALIVKAGGHRIRIFTESDRPIEGSGFASERPHHPARPGSTITWAVDRVRAMSWFGNDRMQFVKALAFDGIDRWERMLGSVTSADGSEEIAEQLGDLRTRAPAPHTDEATGWPPARMEPVFSIPLEGEGKWVSLEGDPFIETNPGAPNPFVFSFIRTDTERLYSQIFVLLWDPRQVELHAVSGTAEPKSATGETGPGIVPREPKVMSRLLAAFNGGFQARHGAFGMMANDVVYLPPKPYGATVAELRDGSTGFGTWPADPVAFREAVSYRQNLTPLVAGGVLNPYRRYWWGGTPTGWNDDSRSVRSGLCLTTEKFVAYFYGNSIDATHLGLAMQRARCAYGIHLDMNPDHVGLEFFRTAPLGKLPTVLLDEVWQARGTIPGMENWEFLARRMMRHTALLNFPRYIERESRDFFYLTLRFLLPGKNLSPVIEPAETDEGVWNLRHLPQYGWPYAVATTSIRPDPARPDTRLEVMLIDPKTVDARSASQVHAQTVVSFRSPLEPAPGMRTLWLANRQFVVAEQAPGPGAVAVTAGYPVTDPRAVNAAAGLGVCAGGILEYAQISSAPRRGADAQLLTDFLATTGCDNVILADQALGVAIGGDHDLSGKSVGRSERGIQLIRAEAPGARLIFEDTPVVSPAVWAPLQARRVAYSELPTASP